MKLLIDTEKEEIEVLESSSFLELKGFLEGIEGGIGYTIVSKKTEVQQNPFHIFSLPPQQGGEMESPFPNSQDQHYP